MKAGLANAAVRIGVWSCAANLLLAVLAAQCSNPTQVPNQTISSGVYNFSDNNALAASNVVINGSASVTFLAGNCIELQPGFHATAGTAGTTFHAWVETAPTADSVSPISGNTLSQQFTWKASSPSGYTNLSEMQVLFNTSVSGVNACYIRYNRASNLLYLADNSGSNWSSGLVPGTSGTAANSQCSIDAAGSSVSGFGNQLTLIVSVTFQTSFSGAKNDYLVAYNNEGLNSTWQQMGTWTVPAPQQYYLTTAVSPYGAGTISPASGWYNSGAVVSVSAAANPGNQFSGFSGDLTGTTTPQNLTINGTKTVTATFASASPPPLVLPSPLKGFTYFPRGHAWYSMLYDWYTDDCETSTARKPVGDGTFTNCGSPYGRNVYQVVSYDLQRLASSGFNLIHLFVWDQDIIPGTFNQPNYPLVPVPGYQAAGFWGLDPVGQTGPANSPANPAGPNDAQHNQWTALAEFISLAKSKNLWVFVDFATSRSKKKIDPPLSLSPADVGTDYGTWINKFIDYLAGYQNVLIWGITYGTGQPTSSDFWHKAYPLIVSRLQQHTYTSPAGRALLAVDSGFELHPLILPQLSGYQWPWQGTQQGAYQWQQLANAPDVLGAAPGAFPPDLYSFQLWNANAGDLEGNLQCVAGVANTNFCPSPTCGNCAAIPFPKMVVTEFGAGSSLESAPIGNNNLFYGDADEPTTTADGQREWVTQMLCMLNRRGINNYAYHGWYDAASWWETTSWGPPPALIYNPTALDLAWGGYWGLSSEDSGYGDKPAWSAMAGFNPGACPGPDVPPTPLLAIQADATYYTVNDTGKINYTAANVTSLDLSEPKVEGGYASYSCNPAQNPPYLNFDLRVGSCAFSNIVAANTGTITLTGDNTDVRGTPGSGLTRRVVTSVTVGQGPIVNGLVNHTTNQACDLTQNPGCVITLGQMDVLEIYGLGFDPGGGNTVELDNGSTQWWFFENDGYIYWDQSRTQINAQIGCLVSPGTWNLYVRNPNSGTPSTAVPVLVAAGGGCP